MGSAIQKARVVGPEDGKAGSIGSIGVRFMIDGQESGGGFSLVEHPMPPRRLAAPLTGTAARTSTASSSKAGSRCSGTRSDRRSGRPDLQAARPMAHVLERGREPARILEVISPAGFEGFFDKLVDLVAERPPDPDTLATLAGEYGLDVDPSTVPDLIAEHGLEFPMLGAAVARHPAPAAPARWSRPES